MVHGTREAEAEAGRLSLSLSLSLREDPASSFGAPAKTEKENSRERFVLCCVVLWVCLSSSSSSSSSYHSGYHHQHAHKVPPEMRHFHHSSGKPPSPRSLAPLPCLRRRFFSKTFPGRNFQVGNQGEARPAAGGEEKVCRESAGGAVGGGRLGARQWRRAGQGRGTR